MQADHTFHQYQTEQFYDELFDSNGEPRPGARVLINRINSLPSGELKQRQTAIDRALLRMGITFTVYGNDQGTEKIFPFDIVPRVVEAAEWQMIESGLKQRIEALNRFITTSTTIKTSSMKVSYLARFWPRPSRIVNSATD